MARGNAQIRLSNRLWAWDHAPGVLVVREAGCHADRQDENPYRPTERTRGLLCASDIDSWHRINDIVRPD